LRWKGKGAGDEEDAYKPKLFVEFEGREEEKGEGEVRYHDARPSTDDEGARLV
jgi:hypothetical protein